MKTVVSYKYRNSKPSDCSDSQPAQDVAINELKKKNNFHTRSNEHGKRKSRHWNPGHANVVQTLWSSYIRYHLAFPVSNLHFQCSPVGSLITAPGNQNEMDAPRLCVAG